MGYIREYKDDFIVPVFTQESGYWHRATKKFFTDPDAKLTWSQ